MQTVTLSLPTIMTIDNYPAPVATEVDGKLVITYTAKSPEDAVKLAKAAVRELVKFRQDKNVSGKRDQNVITFTFGVEGGELPATWKGRSAAVTADAKPAILTEIQEALKGYGKGVKAAYFNSSVNHGLTVEGVPVGLQFEASGPDDDCVAKLMAGKKEWTKYPIEDADQAVQLVERLQALLVDL